MFARRWIPATAATPGSSSMASLVADGRRARAQVGADSHPGVRRERLVDGGRQHRREHGDRHSDDERERGARSRGRARERRGRRPRPRRHPGASGSSAAPRSSARGRSAARRCRRRPRAAAGSRPAAGRLRRPRSTRRARAGTAGRARAPRFRWRRPREPSGPRCARGPGCRSARRSTIRARWRRRTARAASGSSSIGKHDTPPGRSDREGAGPRRAPRARPPGRR